MSLNVFSTILASLGETQNKNKNILTAIVFLARRRENEATFVP
jgi:hypothetical protein